MDMLTGFIAEGLCHLLVGYLLTPRILLSHVVSTSLFYSMSKQSADIREFVTLVARHELIQFLIWIVLPVEGLAVAVSLLVCVRRYERVVGECVEVHRSTSFSSDIDLSRWLKDASDVHVTSDARGRQQIDTPLQCLRRVKKREKVDNSESNGVNSAIVIDLENIRAVQQGCDKDMLHSVQHLDIEASRCMTLRCIEGRQRGQDGDLVLVAESPDSCAYWLSLLQQMTGTKVDDISKEWLKKLVSLDWMTAAGTETGPRGSNFTANEAFSVLQKAKRNADRNYVVEVFKSLYRDGGKTRSSTSDYKLTLDEFVALFKYTAITANIQHIFNRMQDARSRKSSIPAKTFFQFLLNQQKERASMDDVLDWIMRNEPVLGYGNLSVAGFANYIMADENSIFSRQHRAVYQDMTQPLCHYFIATSHNTYLTKDQLKSKSSVDAYVNALKRGCKCVELDCWDGPNSEPVIYHGHTLTSKILFRDVIQAIKDHAFCVSRYPVILSFENHCSVEQQKVMAMHLRKILGSTLHVMPPNAEEETCLPSPEDLSGYVLVKAKKCRVGELDDFDDEFSDDDFSDDEITDEDLAAYASRPKNSLSDDMADTVSMRSEMDEEEMMSSTNGSVSSSSGGVSTSGSSKRPSTLKNLMQSMQSMELFRKSREDKPKVTKIAQELSDLVTYCQATSFKNFEHSRLNCKHYEMSSFGEKRALRCAKDDPRTFLQYNQRQLSRIYPAGARIDSSNYDPMSLWSVGCQLVALNYQTACREMQWNQGLFQDNGGCGYVLKPEFMRKENIEFDPRGPFREVHTLTIREIYGHQIPYKADKLIKCDRNLLVQVKVVGVDADNHVQRTRTVKNNGYNPTWDDELVFKIHVPDLALVNFAVYTKDAFIAQFTLPFTSIQQGYRKIPLQNKYSEPVPNAYLLVHVGIQAPI